MLKAMYVRSCKILRAKNYSEFTVRVAMLWVVLLTVVSYSCFLIFIMIYDLTFILEQYGQFLFFLSSIIYSILYFYLVYKFNQISRFL